MNDNELKKAIFEKRHSLSLKGILLDLLLLLFPILIEAIIVLAGFYTGLLALLLTYFVLPMFYTVERRIRTRVSNIGDPSFSYADGYKAFFASSQGGIFGIFSAFFIGLIFFMLFDLIFSFAFPMLANTFPGARAAYDSLLNAYKNDQGANIKIQDFMDMVQSELPKLTQPLSVYLSLSLFLPILYGIFFSVDTHLSDHYLAGIVLPDIDLNISASQARAVSRVSYRSLIYGERIKYVLRLNWPLYLLFVVLYGVSTYLVSLITVNSVWVMLLVIALTPTLSFFYGLIINYFCLLNAYCVEEKIAPLLLERLNVPTKTSIYQTYINPNYIHGQESAARGSFIPAPTVWEEGHGFGSSAPEENPNDIYEPSHETTDAFEKPAQQNTNQPSDSSDPQGGVFDFSQDSEDDTKEDKS